MKDLIIFDLDGVLVDAKTIHFEALNDALADVDEKYIISKQDHFTRFDGLKTRTKLEILSKTKGLPYDTHQKIWNTKQDITYQKIKTIENNTSIIEVFNYLKNQNIQIACCSNSIRQTVYTCLSRLGIIEFFDLILSNQDVVHSKPHPEIYWKAMSTLGKLPCETLIVEDSPIGLLAAERSGANVCRVKNVSDLTIEKIKNSLYIKTNIMNIKWQDDKLNVLIPMAGAGSRFEKAGYTFPKPLIEVRGKPMIQVVVDNLSFNSHHIFIAQKEHRKKFNLDNLLPLIVRNSTLIEVDGLTEGAACTTLLAEELINNNNPLIIANSDQILEWNTCEFMYKMQEQDVDAGIVTFNSNHPKWSFAKVNENDFVTQVAEKNPISNIATCGIYYWKKGSDYVKYAKKMILNNERFNNEFYVCPVFNEAIKDGKKIKIYNIEKMWGIGTPEDLDFYLKNYKP